MMGVMALSQLCQLLLRFGMGIILAIQTDSWDFLCHHPCGETQLNMRSTSYFRTWRLQQEYKALPASSLTSGAFPRNERGLEASDRDICADLDDPKIFEFLKSPRTHFASRGNPSLPWRNQSSPVKPDCEFTCHTILMRHLHLFRITLHEGPIQSSRDRTVGAVCCEKKDRSVQVLQDLSRICVKEAPNILFFF